MGEVVTLAERVAEIRPHRVVHVGAHRAQEAPMYAAAGASVMWIEADQTLSLDLINRLAPYEHQWHTIACCAEDRADRHFYIASNDGESSSLHTFADHRRWMPGVEMERITRVQTVPLDDLGLDGADWFTLDVQGAELRVLRGAVRTLRTVQSIWCEVSRAPLYTDGVQFDDVTAWLDDAGFDLIDVEWSMFDGHHGDAFYRRRQWPFG